MANPSAGYAVLQVIPSVRGISDELRRQLVGPAGDAGDRAGAAAGEGLKSKLKAGAAAAGIAAGAILVKGIGEAIDQANITSTLQAQLGTSNKVAAAQGKVAGKLYSTGVSDSFQGAADAIKATVQAGLAPPGTTNKQLTSIATKATDVANVFGQDMPAVANVAAQAIRTGLAKNSTEAFDLITKGFQGGTDKAGDFLDTINEYGTQFRKAGLDGATSVGLLNQAIGAGARDADIAADAIKEFSIRAVDGSKTTSDGFKLLGLNADDMAAKFGKGGKNATAALDTTLDRLRNIKDPVKQSQAAVALFGTQAEDLGAALFAMDPSSAAKKLGDFAGSTKRMGDTLRSGPSYEIQKFTRALKQGFVDFLGGKVLPIITQAGQFFNTYLLPPISTVASVMAAVLVPALGGLFKAGRGVVNWLRDMGTWLIPIAIAVGGLALAMSTSAIAAGAQALAIGAVTVAMRVARGISLAFAAAQAVVNAVMAANPIILVIVAIVALVAALVIAYKKSETFRAIVQGAFNGVLAVGKAIGSWFSGPFVRFFTDTIPGAFRAVLNWVKANWPYLLGALTGPIGLAVVWIIKHWSTVRDFFGQAWGVIKRNAIDPILLFFGTTLPNAAKGARDIVVGAIRWLALRVLDAFGSIIGGAAKLFGWVPGVGGKLKQAKKAFDTFRDDVNKALGGINNKEVNTFVNFKGKSISAFSAGRMATGGRVKGPGTGTSDSVPIWASDGEHMWTAREVQAVGGHGAMERMRAEARTGAFRGYASGGAVSVHPHRPSSKAISGTANRMLLDLTSASARAIFNRYMSMISAGPSFTGLGAKVGASAAAAMAYAQNLLRARIYGWSMVQWPAWRSLGMGESGWRWNARNPVSGAYGIPQCMDKDTMILTRRGWLRHDEVRVGDETIGYNSQTRESEWTRITAVHHGVGELRRFGTSQWSAVSTPNHRWLVERTEPLCDLPPEPGTIPYGKCLCGCGGTTTLAKNPVPEKGIKRGMPNLYLHGHHARGKRRDPDATDEYFVEQQALQRRQQIVLARPAATESRLDITLEEAALLAWIAGDGWRVEHRPVRGRNAEKGYKSGSRPMTYYIGQTKKENWAAIEAAIDGHGRISRTRERQVDGELRRDREWRLSAPYARDLTERAGNPKTDCFQQVLAMSTEQREAWLAAIIQAEGHVSQRGNRASITQISQKAGPLAEAIVLAVYLSGRRPSVYVSKRTGGWHGAVPVWTITLTSPRTGEPRATVGGKSCWTDESLGVQEVWCVTTDLSTWTARQGNEVFLTGNSLPPGKMASAGADWRTNPATQIRWMASYIRGRYGTPANAYATWLRRRPHWYDGGGALPPGLSLAYNGTRRPEAVLTDRQWSALFAAARGGDGGGDTYNFYPRTLDMTVRDLDTLQRRKDADARVGRPR
ncbi:phage tail tape measure protein [Streptomyces sp. NPDC001406]|uniref:aggregation-promoting factor C-terminal-like domain-containing protein n=1 Tax=Streptomyces sp. NPDC001406 TaxID=3364572 RepID=UPI0036753CBA